MAQYADRKDRLLGALTGTVLEIGAGRGANFARFATTVTWIGLEPDPRRLQRLARTASQHGHTGGRALCATAESIPLASHSVDAVVATVVLCSVASQEAVLAEIQRVLVPGGSFVFFEHVAAPDGTWISRLQRFWAPYSRRFDAGCDPTRDTWRTIQDAGFRDVDLNWFGRRPQLGIHGPYIAGRAQTR